MADNDYLISGWNTRDGDDASRKSPSRPWETPNRDLSQDLENNLIDACVRPLNDSTAQFVPQGTLRMLMTREAISASLTQSLRDVHGLVEQIYDSCYKIFAVLVTMGFPSDIVNFIQEDISDVDLPLIRDSTKPSRAR